ncbi:MAG: ABC transporter ATP-binding protein [Pseudomonadota bacterium]
MIRKKLSKYWRAKSSIVNSKQLDPIGIHCHSLHVCYGRHVAIEKLTGVFEPGTLTAIVGPNGGGKSTLLKVMNGTHPHERGAIKISPSVQDHIAYLPQHTEIDRSFPISVKDLVAMGLCHQQGFFTGITEGACSSIDQSLERVGMLDCKDRSLHTLSGGQLQRTLFARMAVQNAPIILLDEPFAAIDAPTMEILADILCMWQQQGRTLVVVLHDLDIVREFFPQTLILARQSVAWGATQDVLTLENLRRAKNLSRGWEVTSCGVAAVPNGVSAIA